MLAPYLTAFLVNILKPKNTSQNNLKKDPNSIRMNNFFTKRSIPVNLYSKMLIFRGRNKSFKIESDLLRAIKSFNFNVTHSTPQDQKLSYEAEKEKNFDIRQEGRKSNRHKSPMETLKPPAIMVSWISTLFSPENLNELCERIKFLLLEKQVGKNSVKIVDEIVAIADKLLEYKCICMKQHKIFLHNWIN